MGITFFPLFVQADVVVNFANGGHATTTPGVGVSWNGTILNNGTSSVAFLNSVGNLTITPVSGMGTGTPVVTIDTAQASGNFPTMLNSGQQYSGVLLKIDVGSTAALGDYLASYTLNAGMASGTNEFAKTVALTLHVVGSVSQNQPITTTTTTPDAGLQMGGLQMPSGLEYGDVETGMYAQGPRLIKLEGGNNLIYWVSGNNLKIPVWTKAVLKSYNISEADVQAVSQEEFDYYSSAKYIRLQNNPRIYKIEDNIKRFIPSSVWNPAGIDPAQIIDVNRTDFNSYKTGKSLTTMEELN